MRWASARFTKVWCPGPSQGPLMCVAARSELSGGPASAAPARLAWALRLLPLPRRLAFDEYGRPFIVIKEVQTPQPAAQPHTLVLAVALIYGR